MREIYILSLLSLIIIGAGCSTTPNDDIGVVPLSGTWSFDMTGSTSDLSGVKCPNIAAGFESGGDAELWVNEFGNIALMKLDEQRLVFHKQLIPEYLYKTGIRMFPSKWESPGTVFFDFVANTTDSIVGTLHWNNNAGCTADYPFTMELIEAELSGEPVVVYPTLNEGEWEVAIEELMNDCEGTIAGFTGLAETINISHSINLDTGEPDPTEIYIDEFNTTLTQLPDTNIYAQDDEPFDIGLPIDASGDILMDYEDQTFEGTMEVQTETSSNQANATIYISSSSGCGAVANVVLTLN